MILGISEAYLFALFGAFHFPSYVGVSIISENVSGCSCVCWIELVGYVHYDFHRLYSC